MLQNYKNKTIVFFGDSITDTCKHFHRDHPYGAGYVGMLKSEFDVSFNDLNITIYNEGIGGNKTEDLISRFEQDVASKSPDLVFMLIGINDVWHLYDQNVKPNITDIINRIDNLVKKIKSLNSEVVLLTPFLFPTDEHFQGLVPYFEQLLSALYNYIEQNNINCIDTYSILKTSDNLALTKDSVHPTIYGHGIIAQAIIDYLEKEQK